ncbi:hypothetical protein [Dyadobacter sp. LHD-138]|uniref:hypothetical protein n=1 Tax=Dyadobacter sp. LHD-138 TaxID=3071413 RepID=UPI0027E1DC0A|nr:hypothetical protein [Dyadobacter sp. LHD-138]MDQ6479194.1 hypothetical protein [Dyadobacter sp. LHD-138]
MGGGGSFSQCLEAESNSGNGAITSDPNASNGQTREEENNYNHYVDYSVTGVPSVEISDMLTIGFRGGLTT